MASGLTWQVTGLWYPDIANPGDFLPMVHYGQIADPINGSVTIPLNDSRLAEVTISTNDPIISALTDATTGRLMTYARLLKVYYRDQLIFWGPWRLAAGSLASETITLSAMDPSIRLIHHYLRRGDLDSGIGTDTHDRGYVTVDHFGLRLIRDAGLNTTEQTDRGVPDLGINDGTNDVVANPSVVMGVARGDQVWSAFQELVRSDDGPDFELEPDDSTPGYYCNLNTYIHLGADVSVDVGFHFGTGKANLDDLTFTDGAEYITHAQVLSRDLIIRRTTADVESSAETGPYVIWEPTKFDARPAFTLDPMNPYGYVISALDAHGQGIVKAYGRPLLEVELDVPPETDDSYVFGVDYKPGDVVSVAGRCGLIDLEPADYRITSVTLRQADANNAVKPELTVVADRVAALGDSTGDED